MFITPGTPNLDSSRIIHRRFVLRVLLLAAIFTVGAPARGQNGVQFKKWKPSLKWELEVLMTRKTSFARIPNSPSNEMVR
jgi:hypothetical protein